MKTLPAWCYIAFAGLLFIVLIVAVMWPRSIQMSYQGKTCFYQPTILPELLRTNSKSFRLEASQRLVVGNVTVAAINACIAPNEAPKVGVHNVGLSVAGLPFIQKIYSVNVPNHPVASIENIEKPIPLSRSLQIELSEPDAIFTYRASFDSQHSTKCDLEKNELQCDIQKLKLDEGETYLFSLDRYFNDEKKDNVILQNIETLRSAKVLKTSIKNGKTVFSKPKSIDITFDKQIVGIKAVLQRSDKKTQDVPLTIAINEKKVHISWKENLSRQATYRLVLYDVLASDGSTMAGKYKTTFKTSGGPKVKTINIGTYRISAATTATITFDQNILTSQNIASHVKATNGAVVSSWDAKHVYVNFANVAPCTTVKITIDGSIKSKYGITGAPAWSYSTRTTCHTITTIGVSLQGRPINAYWFGKGSKTILFTGAIHGDESSTYYLMLRWIDALEANYELIPGDIRVVVVPAINPDGVASGTRTNARNVDLNRNFDTNDWKKNITNVYNQSFPGGGGSSAMSEPESKAIGNLAQQLSPRVIISYHSIGSVVLANPVSGAGQRAQRYAAYSGYSYSASSSDTFDYSITGTADDYYAQKVGVPSIVVELGSHTYHQFEHNQNAMWKMLY